MDGVRGSYGIRGQEWPGWNSPLVFPKDMWHGMRCWARKRCLASHSAKTVQGWVRGRGREGRSQVGSVHRTSRGGEEAPCSVGGAAAAMGSLLSLLQVLGQASPSPFSPGIPEEPHGWGPGQAEAAQGLSRRRVPGHLSHRKGTKRRVKVAVKV